MNNNKSKCIRLSHNIYLETGRPFFITISTYNWKAHFEHEAFASIVADNIKTGPISKEADLMAYCVMPDHVHVLLAPEKINLIPLFQRWKSFTTGLLHKSGIVGQVWQRCFHDHALRKEETISKVAEYIVHNPVRKNLVSDWRDYSFAWHKWVD